jgi:predicted nucleic acid-binding protein
VRFVDTNVLLYAVSTAKEEKAKAEIARSLLDESEIALSVQVLQEFYVQATRAGKRERLDHEQAGLLIESWLRFRVKEIDVPLMQAALKTSERYRIAYWDAAIIEAARALDCSIVLSEDLNDGQDYGGITVADPFARA